MKEYKVKQNVIDSVLRYLATKPYQEVNDIISELIKSPEIKQEPVILEKKTKK